MKRIRSWLLLLVSLLVVGFFFYLPELKQLLMPDTPSLSSQPEADSSHQAHQHGGHVHAERERCNLNSGICAAELSGGRHLNFSVAPRDIPAMKPVRLEAEVEGGEILDVRVMIEGRDMYMGEQQIGLTRVQPGKFTGELIVPACDMDHEMVWLARVDVINAEKTEQVVFEFTATE